MGVQLSRNRQAADKCEDSRNEFLRGATVISTDSDGMYELAGLRPDNYTVKLLDVPANQAAEDRAVRKEDMVGMGAGQLDIRTAWAGRIEGSVKDSGDGPVRVMLELENADGMPLGDRIMQSPSSVTDGSFRFPGLPAGGRYVLLI